MPRTRIEIMARVDWIKQQLHAGRPWTAAIMAAEFGCSTKTVYHTLRAFRELYPDWVIRFDAREKSYYLDSSPQNPVQHSSMSSELFRQIRGRLRLSQERLADCLGVAQKTVSAYELGQNVIPRDIGSAMSALNRAHNFGYWVGKK